MSQEKRMYYQKEKMGKCNEPPKPLGTRVHNNAQMARLSVGSSLDSFLDLLFQSVGPSQESWLRPGPRVHSHPNPEPSVSLLSSAPKTGLIFCLSVGTLLSGETPPGRTCRLGTALGILGVLKKDLPHLSPSWSRSLPISMPSCIVDFHDEGVCGPGLACPRQMNE